MTCTYAVTFEFETRPPLTHRGLVTGTSANVCMSRATAQAQRALGPIRWDSCVCVLLERVQNAGESQAASRGASDALLGDA